MKVFMIVDDSPVIRKVGRRLIEDMGFIVAEAGSAEEATAMCTENMPDAAMIDWELPDMSGIDLIRQIMALPGNENTKLLYCTSQMMVADMTKAKRAGAHGFIMKPFNRALLAAKFYQIGLIEDEPRAA